MSASHYSAAESASSAITAPPPAYEDATAPSSSAFVSSQCGLNSAIWLSIFQSLIDLRLPKERQIHGRHELHSNVRLVCREFYLASMHLLRSHHLAAYLRHIRPPYTSDPYPTNTDDDRTSAPRRETEMLDLFIAVSTRAEMETWESSLLMTNEGIEDLFTHHQPRARLEDLVIARGSRDRVIYPLSREKWEGVVAEDIRIDLRFKSAAIKLITATSSSQALRTVVEVPRGKEELLESTASQLVRSLSRLRISRTSGLAGRVYQVLYY